MFVDSTETNNVSLFLISKCVYWKLVYFLIASITTWALVLISKLLEVLKKIVSVVKSRVKQAIFK
jgi:hypothetical protein